MEEQNRYEDEEILKSQEEINEKVYRFKAEIKEEFAQFRAQIRAQHNEAMADIRSKLNRIMAFLPDRIGAPLDHLNADPEESKPMAMQNWIGHNSREHVDDRILVANDMPDSKGIISCESTIKHSIDKENEQDEENDDNGCGMLSIVYVKSILGSVCESSKFGSTNGSHKACVKGVSSRMDAVLGENTMKEDAHLMFDKMSTPTSMEQNDNIVTDILLIHGSEVTEVNSFNSSSKLQFEEVCMFVTIKNRWMNAAFWIDGIMFIFDPGGDLLLQMGRVLCKSILRDVINWYAATENHYGEKFENRSAYTSLMETGVKVVGLIVNEKVELWVGKVLILAFDPGGFSFLQRGCDLFVFNREGDYCLTTIMVDLSVKAVTHIIRIMIVSVRGVGVRFDREFFANGLRIVVQTGTGQMGHYVNDFPVHYSLLNKAIKEDSKVLHKRDIDRSSCVELIAAFCGYILLTGGSEDSGFGMVDETLEGYQFITKMKGIVALITQVCYGYSSPLVYCSMNEFMHTLHTLKFAYSGFFAYSGSSCWFRTRNHFCIHGNHFCLLFEEMAFIVFHGCSLLVPLLVGSYCWFRWGLILRGIRACALFVYILEDKDVFKRVEKWIIPMVSTWVKMENHEFDVGLWAGVMILLTGSTIICFCLRKLFIKAYLKFFGAVNIKRSPADKSPAAKEKIFSGNLHTISHFDFQTLKKATNNFNGNHFTKLLRPKSVGNDEGIGQNEGNHGNEIDGECAQKLIEAATKQQKKLNDMAACVPMCFPERPTGMVQDNKDLQYEASKEDLDLESLRLEEPTAPKGKKGRASAPVWHITADELNSLPQYMKGKLTLDKVNAAINDLAAYADANAQLPGWSSESSKLMAWSSVLSFIHNSIKIRMKQIDYYVSDCLVSNWHNLLHSMESFYDAKSLVHDTVAIPYSMHLWGLVLRSIYVVLDGHGVLNTYEKNNVASIYPDDAILQKGSISDISIQSKESMHVGRGGYSIYKEAVVASSKEKAEVGIKIFVWDSGVSHFTTLRTRRLLRGRICHVPRLKLERRLVSVSYELLAISDVI